MLRAGLSRIHLAALRGGTVDIGIYEGSLGVIDMPTEPYRVD